MFFYYWDWTGFAKILGWLPAFKKRICIAPCFEDLKGDMPAKYIARARE
jgi:hypothetical protein